ncbi:restriction endonuclease subunit S [Polluticoccus soli]
MRFKGFEDEWEEKSLGDVVELKAGYAFKRDQMLSEKSTYQLIKMSNVYQNELIDRNPSFWQTIDSKQKEFILKRREAVLTLTGAVGKQDFGHSAQINEDDKFYFIKD